MRSVFRISIVSGVILGALSACAPTVPDSGVGFGTEQDAARARELELAGGTANIDRLAPPQALSSEPMSAVAVPAPAATGSAEEIAQQTAAALSATSANPAPGTAVPGAPMQTVASSSGLSAENDFSAVSESRSIQGDAALIASNRAQYQVIQPTELPKRAGASQPNIVSYALETSHSRGTRLYSRTGVNLAANAERNCRNFASADLAQIEFLSQGGPQQDGAGLDPDGDGFACDWDPAPFRRAVGN